MDYTSVNTIPFNKRTGLHCVVTARFVLAASTGTILAISHTDNIRFVNTPLVNRTAWLSFSLQCYYGSYQDLQTWRQDYFAKPEEAARATLVDTWKHLETGHFPVMWCTTLLESLPPWAKLEARTIGHLARLCSKDSDTPEALVKLFSTIPPTEATLTSIKYLADVEKMETILEL